jgi:hypothetical protein
VASPSGARGTIVTSGDLANDLAMVRQARIYFDHHSVGANILAGVRQIDREVAGSKLRLASPEEANSIQGPVLVEGGGGHNGDPKGKIDHFAKVIRVDAGLKPDVAFMKLCFTDIGPRTDVENIFAYYRRSMESLEREYPGIRFAHVTVPLTAKPVGLKARLFRLIGREVWDDASNRKRAEFNRLLRETFASDPVFDLARLEATAPDGNPVGMYLDEPSMFRGYTNDGGHLNSLGERLAGAGFIRFVANARGTRREQR